MKPKYQPRIRMFAGPNGSGKSSLKTTIEKRLGGELLGVYVNADEIEKNIKAVGFLNLADFQIQAEESEILHHFLHSSLLKKGNMLAEAKMLTFEDQKLYFFNVNVNSYFASVAADFIRIKLMENLISFSFETVMSFEDKLELLKKAKKLGYKTYLYFIATQNPLINIERIKQRVQQGGHDVASDKVISRYFRCLSLMYEAIKMSWRSYVFDSSQSGKMPWIAEIKEGEVIYMVESEKLPDWFIEYWVSKDY